MRETETQWGKELSEASVKRYDSLKHTFKKFPLLKLNESANKLAMGLSHCEEVDDFVTSENLIKSAKLVSVVYVFLREIHCRSEQDAKIYATAFESMFRRLILNKKQEIWTMQINDHHSIVESLKKERDQGFPSKYNAYKCLIKFIDRKTNNWFSKSLLLNETKD